MKVLINNIRSLTATKLSDIVGLSLLFFSMALLSNVSLATSGGSECSIYAAVYKPHPNYYLPDTLPKIPKPLDFTLVAKRAELGEGNSRRGTYFYIDAFDRSTNEKVSTVRFATTCSLGISVCGLSTSMGQFNKNEALKELKSGMGFKPIALDSDFFGVPFWGPSAPKVIVLPGTANQIKAMKTPLRDFEAEKNEYMKFYTDEMIEPDFTGFDVWILDKCISD